MNFRHNISRFACIYDEFQRITKNKTGDGRTEKKKPLPVLPDNWDINDLVKNAWLAEELDTSHAKENNIKMKELELELKYCRMKIKEEQKKRENEIRQKDEEIVALNAEKETELQIKEKESQGKETLVLCKGTFFDGSWE